MKYGAFVPRQPPLPRTPGYYTMRRRGYPKNPLQPIPLMGSGHAIDYTPYPSREQPDYQTATTPPVQCPPGMAWSSPDRMCKVVGPTAQFKGLKGYGGYLSPELAKVWQWDSFAVGLGSMAATMTLGIAASLIIQGSHKKGRKPKVDMSLVPSLIPGIGAGILGYLLRWNMNNCCPCEEPEVTGVAPRTVYTIPPSKPCPEGTVRTPRGCEELI